MSALLHVVIGLVALALLFRLILHIALLVTLLLTALTSLNAATLLDTNVHWWISLLVCVGIGIIGIHYYFAHSDHHWFRR